MVKISAGVGSGDGTEKRGQVIGKEKAEGAKGKWSELEQEMRKEKIFMKLKLP